ncbi:hypothetical protein [Nonomuraea longispora]|uniref:hypothetical protein n=1 Tax=Nonomuraea longispora TaxID=1848320 RepID=UPI001405570B|nr:hypothetical protein [Nonomuraea longispora]
MAPEDVWHKARIKRKKGTKGEREVSPATFLQELDTALDEIHGKLDELLGEVRTLRKS